MGFHEDKGYGGAAKASHNNRVFTGNMKCYQFHKRHSEYPIVKFKLSLFSPKHKTLKWMKTVGELSW